VDPERVLDSLEEADNATTDSDQERDVGLEEQGKGEAEELDDG
jgi:hypothetical protein